MSSVKIASTLPSSTTLRSDPQGFVDGLADFISIPRFSLSAPELTALHTSSIMTHPRSYRGTRHANQLAGWLKARQLGRIVNVVRTCPLGKLFLGGGQAIASPSAESLKTVYELFRNEIEELEITSGRNLSAWKGASRAEVAYPLLVEPQRPMQAQET